MKSSLVVLGKLLDVSRSIEEALRIRGEKHQPITSFSPNEHERHVAARIMNEIVDDLEVLAERLGIQVQEPVVRSIDADDEAFFDDILEQQEREDFAMDTDMHNFDHSEML